MYDDASREIDCVSEYVTSSYVPAVEVLLQDSEEDGKYGASLEESMLAVVEKSLPAVIMEIEAVEEIVEKQEIQFIKLGVSETCQATVTRVVELLPKARIVHFACHGKQDAANPLDSYLKLEDGRLFLSTILRDCRIQGSELAFLCACETATGDKRAPDEAMSLGSCLVYSGFRNVIATMWCVLPFRLYLNLRR
jgi:CHAT domain-containing protein